MDTSFIPSSLWLVAILFLSWSCECRARSSKEVSDDDTAIQATVMKRMENIQRHLVDVTQSVGDLDDQLSKALFDCLGLHTELCEALEVDNRLRNRQSLSSSWSPGKRTSSTIDQGKVNQYRGLYNDLKRKRAMLKRLSKVIDGVHNSIGMEKKRSCSLNLGFHCQTEDIANFADMLNYLESPMSPGRKRSVNLKH